MKKKPKEPKLSTGLTPTSISKVSTSTKDSPSKWIRTEKSFSLPLYVKEAFHRLSEAGHVAYLVGGSVRDFLLEIPSKDHDIATSATPEQLVELFPQAIEVGKSFGVIKVPTGPHTPLLEIATFREDLEYRDHRRPTQVVFSGPIQDAERRDFTINALFFDPKTSRILDTVGGVADLREGKIKAIGVPKERFKEDALRLLRAIRFLTQFGFTLDEETSLAITAQAKLVTHVSSERICDELTRIFQGPRPAKGLELLSSHKLLGLLLPEVEALKGVPQIPAMNGNKDVWGHLLKMLTHFAQMTLVRSAPIAWVSILHEIGKAAMYMGKKDKNFNGHETEASRLSRKISSKFKMSREDSEIIAACIEEQLKFREVFHMKESTLQRWIRVPYFPELLAFHQADAMASDGNLAFYEFCRSRLTQYQTTNVKTIPKLIDGRDLIQMGFLPGPEFAQILTSIEDLALEKKVSTKEEALEYVLKHFVK